MKTRFVASKIRTPTQGEKQSFLDTEQTSRFESEMQFFMYSRAVSQERCHRKRETDAKHALGSKNTYLGGFTRKRSTKKVHRIRARAQQIDFATPPQCEKRCFFESVVVVKGALCDQPGFGFKRWRC